MTQWHFPDDFLWGTATASYQVEGRLRGMTVSSRGADTLGKTESVSC
jgi:beta-glucosidase/6-phospho-beta-glucosidase/beta-galactosidase